MILFLLLSHFILSSSYLLLYDSSKTFTSISLNYLSAHLASSTQYFSFIQQGDTFFGPSNAFAISPFTYVESVISCNETIFVCPKRLNQPNVYIFNNDEQKLDEIPLPSQLDTSKYPLWELDCVCFNKRFVVFFIGTVNYFEYDKENSQWIEITSFLTYLKKSKASDDFNNYRNSYIGLLLDQINSTSGYFKYCTYTLDNPIRVSRLWHSTNPVGDIIEVKIDSPNNIIEVYSLFKNLNIVSFRYVFNYENFRETKTEFTIPIDINKSEFQLDEFKLLNNSYYYLFILKSELTKYLGIGDIENNIVIYITEVPELNLATSYLQYTNQILVNLNNGTSYLICPFNKPSKYLCEFCASSQVLLLDPFNVNICVSPNETTMDIINGIYAKCKEKYEVYNGECVTSLSLGHYTVYPFGIPSDECDSSYSQIDIVNNYCYHCYEYEPKKSFYNDNCVDDVPTSTYCVDESKNIYQDCDSNCLTCDIIATNCTSCSGSLVCNGNKCVSTCPWYSATENRVCVNCKDTGRYKFTEETFCRDAKPENTIIFDYNANLIKKCYITCQKCSGLSDDINNQKCTKCISDYYLTENGNCDAVCDDLTYEDSSLYQCVNCKAKYNKVKYYGKDKECINIPSNVIYYIDNDKGVIDDCYATCGACSAHGNETNNLCDSCINGYSMDSNNNCEAICKEPLKGYHNGKCVNCKEVYFIW